MGTMILIPEQVIWATAKLVQKTKVKVKNMMRLNFICCFLVVSTLSSGSMFPSDVLADGTLYYSASDGMVRGINMVTGAEKKLITGFIGSNPGAGRNIAFDPQRNLLIYCVSDGSLASVNLTTLTGASFTVTSAYFLGVNPGAGRIITYDFPKMTASVASRLLLLLQGD